MATWHKIGLHLHPGDLILITGKAANQDSQPPQTIGIVVSATRDGYTAVALELPVDGFSAKAKKFTIWAEGHRNGEQQLAILADAKEFGQFLAPLVKNLTAAIKPGA